MEKSKKKDYNYKPKFKRGDIIVRNDKWHNSFSKGTKTQYVNPYHKPFISTITINHINISEFSTFFHKGYVFKEQQNSYDSKIVDVEYDLHIPSMRKKKIKRLKKCINRNLKVVT